MTTILELARGSHSAYEPLILAALALKREDIPGYRDATLRLTPNAKVWHEQRMMLLIRSDAHCDALLDHPCYVDHFTSKADADYSWWAFRFPKALNWLPKWIVDTEKLEPADRTDAWIDIFNRVNALKDQKMRESMKLWLAPVIQTLYDNGTIDVHNMS